MKSYVTALIVVASLAWTGFRSYDLPGGNISSYFGNMAGTWVMYTSNGAIYEEWKMVNDTLMLGKSWKEKDGEKTMLEDVRLVCTDKTCYYEPHAYGQNDERRVVYTQTELATSKEMVERGQAHSLVTVVFSEPSHDFPRYIKYTIKPESMIAKVGNDATFKEAHTYKYVRVK